MTAWDIDTATAHSIVNRTSARAEEFAVAAVQLRDAVSAARTASNSQVIAAALEEAHDKYAGLLVQNASTRSETACSAVREALGAYQAADFLMAAEAQQKAAQAG